MDNKQAYKDFRQNEGFYFDKGYLYKIKGEETINKFNTLVTKDIVFAEDDTCDFCFILTKEGSFYTDITYYKLEEFLIIRSSKNLDEMFIKEKINYEDISKDTTIIQVEGLKSPDLANKFYEYDIMALKFKYLVRIKDKALILARFGYSGEYGYQFIISNSNLKPFIEKYFNDKQMTSQEIIDYTNFEVLQPNNAIIENNKDYSLFDLNYGWSIDWMKIKFRGKNVAEENVLKSNVCSIGFRSINTNLKVGDKVEFNGQKIGHIILVYKSIDETHEGVIGNAVVEKDYAVSGIQLQSNSSILHTASAPYIIPYSWYRNENDSFSEENEGNE
ncbi:hypothetical protein [Lactobacillus hominis]|uniref:hypothetical protein n=1 Tax=Lactobacillus hominis TaxID=1203033 RepID=UPI0026ED6D46|nr:hypothetical protein [Lactobacillus hominis]